VFALLLEVIATNVADVKAASKYGADRIELCTGMKDDGLTPSYGLIEAAVEHTAIPINVIVRPHSQSFSYDSDDIQMMQKDIDVIKKIGANGVVIGALTKDHQIDIEAMKRLLEVAEGLDVTFHRAFDHSQSLTGSLQKLFQFKQIKKVLTAGGTNPAPESARKIKQLKNIAEHSHIEIMPGYGIKLPTLETLIQTVQPSEIHIGSGIRQEESFMMPIDSEKIEQVKRMLKNFSKNKLETSRPKYS
jgi:copper homeostasis protein